MNVKIQRIYQISIWIIAFEGVGFLMGRLTKGNIEFWYNGLNKSLLTPPSYTFGIVWTILYAMIAYVGYQLWVSRNKISPGLCYLYGLNIFLNWTWTPLFFQLHWVGVSFFWIVLLTFVTFIMTLKLSEKFIALSVMFAIYFLWLIFASYLNGYIFFNN